MTTLTKSDFAFKNCNAAVLLCIRENPGLTERELLRLLQPLREATSSEMAWMRREVRGIVQSFVRVGLVEIRKRQLYTTCLLEEFQSVLPLSLRELCQVGWGSIQVSPFFGRAGRSRVRGEVFVLMPFIDSIKPVYEDHICKIAREEGYKTYRADEIFASGSIIYQIWSSLYYCKLVVADLTGRNPNVFYEVGVAHAVGKQIILIAQSIDDVPFDLRHLRCIIYEMTPRGMVQFEATFREMLVAELKAAQEFTGTLGDNDVLSRSRRRVPKHLAPNQGGRADD